MMRHVDIRAGMVFYFEVVVLMCLCYVFFSSSSFVATFATAARFVVSYTI